jgi:hypothetical protein
MGSMEDYNASVESTRAALAESPEMRDFIRYATLAPNGHNTQPWRFRIGDGHIEILPDFARRTPVVDPDDHHLFVGLGCAAENLSLAARARGRSGDIEFASANDGSAIVSLAGTPSASAGAGPSAGTRGGSPAGSRGGSSRTSGSGPAAESALFDAIPKRQSSRAEYDGRPVSAADLKTLAGAAAIPGVDLVLLTSRSQIEGVRELVVAGNSAQMADAAFVRELKSWLRFSPREAIEAGDGMFSATTGNPSLPAWLGPAVFDLLFKPAAENDKYARQLRSSAGIAVFVSQHADRDHWVRAGRAAQRFALQATALGLKHAFVNQPVEVASLRPELASFAGLPRRRPDLVMRFGYGPTLPFSARRPVAATLA